MIRNHYETVKNSLNGAGLCIVTKYRSTEEILSYYAEGERIFAENHAQELLAKAPLLPADIRWQFIGHLQRNKVRSILPYVSCIQSLDSLELAKVIEKEAARIGKTVSVLAEFHLAEEDENKTGLRKEDALSFFAEVKKYEHLDLCGIMVMGPHTEDSERICSVFREGKALFDELQNTYGSDRIRILSMGMSSDYPLALSCGSTMVRIGTYLFQE